MQKQKYNWLPDFVYGGIDGSVTTFAVVAGVVGAGLSTPIILIMGFANLFADGFSMAIGKYSSDKAEIERIKHVTEMEKDAIKNRPGEETVEINGILEDFGFRGKDLDRATEIITSDPATWVHMMLHHEFHIIEDNLQPKKGALATFISFQLIGLIPLLGYMLNGLMNFSDTNIFIITAVSTLFALFLVGTIKSKFTKQSWILAGISTMLIGGIAASIAFLVGYLLRNLA